MAHALDPEWISAWVGQAYVASLWGTSDSGAIFQHAFESSNGSSVRNIREENVSSKGFFKRLLIFPIFFNRPNLATVMPKRLLDNYQAYPQWMKTAST